MERRFAQVDVFGAEPYKGNPVAVVLDGDGLSDERMRDFARWTNLSETTFVLPPTAPGASYRVRIFTPGTELPFAGHPTLGTCHAWLDGRPGDTFVQECGVGLVTVRRTESGLAFAAPPRVRSGAVSEEDLALIAAEIGLSRAEVVDAQWVDNGPGWVAVMLESAVKVLDVPVPSRSPFKIGLVGPYPPGGDVAYEVRAFFPDAAGVFEDPVTGSLNASVAQWLTETGRFQAPYAVSQGTAMLRSGRVHVDVADGAVWIGGSTTTVITGTVSL